MQKLFENWRSYKQRVLREDFPDPNDPRMNPSVDPETGEVVVRGVNMSSEDIENWLGLVGFADITGVSGYPAVYNALKNFKKTPNLINAGWAALAVLGALPVVAPAGKLGTVANAAKIKKTATEAIELAADLRPVNPRLADKLEEAARVSLKDLKHYISTTQGLAFFKKESLENLLEMIKLGRAAGFSGTAFRGTRASDVLRLVDQLNIPGVARRDGLDYSKVRAGRAEVSDIANQADHFLTKAIKKAKDKVGEWTEIALPTNNVTLDVSRGGANSFTKSWKQAEIFADATDYQKGAFEVIFQAKAQGKKFVDVVATMDKNKINFPDYLRDEQEIFAIGDILVEKMFIRMLQ